ncbi:AraC family transcriptional regulator [Marinobacter sp. OP 3.4]|uniref:AraC family transcriptional regulator n=1 Tax=Marinobacter sp. OP 3.4 TaxID=3076501 RepID=UPI002E2032AA
MSLHQREELAAIIARFSCGDGIHTTAIKGVNCIRFSELNARLPSVYNPSLCVIMQGQKRVWLENEIYDYRPSEYLVVSVDLPVIGEVTQGSDEKPYLCLQIELDLHELTELLVQFVTVKEGRTAPERGIFVGTMDATLEDCVLRLARLLDTPGDIPLLGPMIKREIYYRLLNSPYGEVITQLARPGSHMQRIAVAIEHLRSNFNKPVKVEDLANQIGMSVSSFHSHFKTVTAMSPRQYQKRFRLLEARQIMMAEMQDAATTAYRVGYESQSHFSRDYARMFGNPPGRDIKQLSAAT